MAAKGTIAKTEIIKKILDVFEGSFVTADNKEMRIPWAEAGVPVEIKIALTCAKDILGNAPVEAAAPTEKSAFPQPKSIHVTEEEAENIRKLMEALNL